MKLSKLGDVTFDVIEAEEVSMTSEVSSHPVEYGRDVTDHIKNNPTVISITGAFTQPDSWQRLKVIRDYYKNRDMLIFTGRNIFHNLVITDLVTDHPRLNALGADFQITLQEIKVAKGRRFGESVIGEKRQTQVAKRINQGRQQVMER